MSKLLENIAKLSRHFGTQDYVTAGGGNSSVKDDKTLWVKPSGSRLAAMESTSFVAIDREKLSLLDDVNVNGDTRSRERHSAEIMTAAMQGDSSGHPSVETPLHNLFPQTYVMHTHPPLVNGMTCAVDGAAACARLFPDALWMPYIDPGITLYQKARDIVSGYEAEHVRTPRIIFLKNHGLFVASETPEEMVETHETIFSRLADEYRSQDIATCLPNTVAEPGPDDIGVIQSAMPGEESQAIIITGPFDIHRAPPSPDNVVYMKPRAHTGELNRASLEAFHTLNGYWPRILITDSAAYALGHTLQSALTALDSAREAALLKRLAAAFGGMDGLSDEAVSFVDNWEAESYRRKQL